MKKRSLCILTVLLLCLAAGAQADTLVVWFSCTGNTRALAQTAAAALGADMFEIVPEQPYTAADINYSNADCRANREQQDPTCRPAIAQHVELSAYDTIVLAYPIWWGEEPRIVDTWLESQDLTGKQLAAICTSGSSGIESSYRSLQSLAPGAQWLGARRFSAGTDQQAIGEWLESIGIRKDGGSMTVQIGDHTLHIQLEDNASADALKALLADGPLTIPASNYGGFEKVCPLGAQLPSDDESITAQPGDVMLYAGDQLVLFYGSNTWAYTRIGRLTDTENLSDILSGSDALLTLQLEE